MDSLAFCHALPCRKQKKKERKWCHNFELQWVFLIFLRYFVAFSFFLSHKTQKMIKRNTTFAWLKSTTTTKTATYFHLVKVYIVQLIDWKRNTRIREYNDDNITKPTKKDRKEEEDDDSLCKLFQVYFSLYHYHFHTYLLTTT